MKLVGVARKLLKRPRAKVGSLPPVVAPRSLVEAFNRFVRSVKASALSNFAVSSYWNKELTALYERVEKAVQESVVELTALTPSDTGVTAASWHADEEHVITGASTQWAWKVNNDNPDVVDWLNYGTRPHVIVPVNARALRFYWKRLGKVVLLKKVNHPGIAGSGFVDRSRQSLEDKLRTIK